MELVFDSVERSFCPLKVYWTAPSSGEVKFMTAIRKLIVDVFLFFNLRGPVKAFNLLYLFCIVQLLLLQNQLLHSVTNWCVFERGCRGLR